MGILEVGDLSGVSGTSGLAFLATGLDVPFAVRHLDRVTPVAIGIIGVRE
jgi:hypothetical protein